MHTIYTMSAGLTKIKSKAIKLTKRFGLATATGIAALGLVMTPIVSAATTVVTDSNLNGWVKSGVGGSINFVPSIGATGTGAAEFTTPTVSSYTRLKKTVDVNVSTISNLSYDTKQVQAPVGATTIADVNLRLYISTTGSGPGTCGTGFDDVLVYEPYYNNAAQVITPNAWQTWTTNQANGYWWSNCGITYNGHTTVGAGGYDTNFKLSDVVAQYPNAKVVSLGLGTGDYNSPWVVQADNLVLNGDTYNFENEPPKVTVTNKDQCKENSWKNVYAQNGAAFRNEGACVSYVASNGKSQN
jgi:hypothetical protein